MPSVEAPSVGHQNVLATAGVGQGQLIQAIENLLAALGYDPGVIDGETTQTTEAAIEEFQKIYKLEVDGRISGTLLVALSDAVHKAADGER